MLIGIGVIWAGELALVVLFVVVEEFAGRAGKPGDSPGLLVAQAALSLGWTLAVVWFIACRRHGKSFLGWIGISRARAGGLAACAGAGLAMAAAAMVISAVWGREDTPIARIASTPAGLVALACVAIPAALVEEVYYRGFIFTPLRGSLERLFRPAAPEAAGWMAGLLAVGAVASWFALIHFPQLLAIDKGRLVGFDLASFACVAAAGLVFTLMRHFSGSLAPSIVGHLSYNAVIMVASFSQLLG
jgi:membrane protease YdiL (CAAX protease family)